jgi:hypothetical protein
MSTDPDLRILALLTTKLLPPEVIDPFDHWRIWQARDAVVRVVRKRLIDDMMLTLFLERLEAADDEAGIFEGIYALAQAVELHRSQMGMHGQYLVLVMSSHLNPWGLLRLNPDFSNPTPSVIEAASELWRLANEHHVDIPALLEQVPPDQTLDALHSYYASRPAPAKTRKNRRSLA